MTYVGRSPAVEVDPDGLGEITVVLGETIKIPADRAAAFLEQPANWRLAEPEKKAAPPAAKQPAKAEEAEN